jgi:hypothetical protein
MKELASGSRDVYRAGRVVCTLGIVIAITSLIIN